MGSIKRFNIKSICDVHRISNFIETGTYLGDSIDSAVDAGINNTHSIEIDPEYYFKAVEKYSKHPNINIHLGSSHTIMPSLLKYSSLRSNCLFWLDAHFPLADKGVVPYNNEKNSSKRMPIVRELSSIIKHRSSFNDVIIIDDLRCFTDDPRIPADPFDVHMSKLGLRGSGCTRESVVGVTLEDILNLSSSVYSHSLVFEDEGYIVLRRG